MKRYTPIILLLMLVNTTIMFGQDIQIDSDSIEENTIVPTIGFNEPERLEKFKITEVNVLKGTKKDLGDRISIEEISIKDSLSFNSQFSYIFNKSSTRKVNFFYENKKFIYYSLNDRGINVIEKAKGTYENLNVFNSSIPSNYITGITEDHSGNRWLSSEQGLIKLTKNNPTLITFNGVRSTQAYCYGIKADAQGNIWFMKGGDLYKFINGEFIVHNFEGCLKNSHIMDVAFHRDEILALTYSGMAIFKNNQWRFLEFKNLEEKNLVSSPLFTVFKDQVLISSFRCDDDFLIYYPKTGEVKNFSFKSCNYGLAFYDKIITEKDSYLSYLDIQNRISIDSTSVIPILNYGSEEITGFYNSTYNNKLYVLGKHGKPYVLNKNRLVSLMPINIFSYFNFPKNFVIGSNKLLSSGIEKSYNPYSGRPAYSVKDKSGKYIHGSDVYNMIASSINGKELDTLDTEYPNFTYGICLDSFNNIWISRGNYLLRFKDNRVDSYPMPEPRYKKMWIDQDMAELFCADKFGRLWISIKGKGVFYIKDEALTFLYAVEDIKYMCLDKDHNVWLSDGKMVYQINEDLTIIKVDFNNDKYIYKDILSLAYIQGKMIVTTDNGNIVIDEVK